MAHFRATIEGNRGRASRLGTKKSGLEITVNGWHIGVDIWVRYDEKTDQDIITIHRTCGSGGESTARHIATIYEKQRPASCDDPNIILH